jgi:hypothetical protein
MGWSNNGVETAQRLTRDSEVLDAIKNVSTLAVIVEGENEAFKSPRPYADGRETVERLGKTRDEIDEGIRGLNAERAVVVD